MKKLLTLLFAILVGYTGLFSQNIITIGTGTLVNTTTGYPTAYGQYYSAMRSQYLILASELTSLGATAGTITSLSWDVVTPTPATNLGAGADGSNLSNFTIYMGATTATDLTSWVPTPTQVYTVPSYITTVGWNNHVFNTSFYWDGISNIIIETCFNNYVTASNYSANAIVNSTTTSFTSYKYYRADAAGVCTNTSVSGTLSQRPNMQLEFLPLPNDAGIAGIVSPASPFIPGVSPLTLQLKNFGNNTLNSVTINHTLNAVPGTPFNWNGPALAPGASTNINLGNITIPTGPSIITATTSNPNGVADGNQANDQFTLNFYACNPLTGTYTIGTGGNYTTFADALFALQTCGVSGPVTFNVLPGTGPITGGFEIGAIPGGSATNAVTFNGNGAVINESTATYILGFNGATYITFNNFQIINTVPATGKFGILIRGNSQYLNITNNIIDAGMGTTSSTAAGIVVSNSTTSATTAGSNGQYLTISNNEIIGGYYGITLMGSASYLNCVGNIVANNIVRDFYYYGIYMSNTENNIISGNELKRMVRTSFSSSTYGLYMTTTRGSKVRGNQIHSCGSGSYSMYSVYVTGSVNTAGNESEFINNAIYNFPTSGTVYGLYFLGTREYVNVYHNTVHLDVQLAGTKYACYFSGAPNNHNVKNNIFSIKGPGTGTKYCIYVATTSTTFVSDHNDLYMGGTGGTVNNVGYWTAARTTLGDWQGASGQDGNSVSVDPQFPGVTDITTNVIDLFQAGTPIPGVVTDIFGNPRNLTAPCIGAFEFVLNNRDAGISQMTEPTLVCPGPATVKVILKNYGLQAWTNATINWTVNSVAQPPVNYVGTLSPGAEVVVTMGSYTFAAGVKYTLVFTSLNPGGLPDQNPANDALTITNFQTGLLGVYTIGPNVSNDFASIADAVTALNTYGVCGNVTINVATGSGPYVGGIEIGNIPGTGPSSTVTFNGNGAVVNESTQTYILAFNGTKYVTINNFKFINSNTANDKFGIMVRGGSQYLQITNNLINVGTTSVNSTTGGIAVSGSTTSATTAGNNGQYLTITGNEVVGGYNCITLMGQASYLDNYGHTIANNIVRDFYTYGIYLTNAENCSILNNDVNRATRAGVTTLYGILLNTSRNIKVRNNKVHSTGAASYSAYPIYINISANVAGSETEIVNNAVYNIPSTSTVYGIYFLGTGNNGINVYNNTVHLNALGSTTKRGFFASTAFTNFNVVNNIFSIQGAGTGAKHCIYSTATSTSFYSNNNILFMGATAGTNYTGYWAAANRTTLADWQTASGQDANSIDLNPIFASDTDILPQSYKVDNKGTYLASVTTDMMGVARNVTTPDIGALEFVGTSMEFHLTGDAGCDNSVKIVPISVINFTNIGAFSMCLNINGAAAVLTGIQNLHPDLNGLMAYGDGNKVRLSWVSLSGTGVSIPNGVMLELVFQALLPGVHDITLNTTDLGETEIIDPLGSPRLLEFFGAALDITDCSIITGVVRYNNDGNFPPVPGAPTPMNNVHIRLMDNSKGVVAETYTNAQGQYSLLDIPFGTYSLSLTTVKPWGGVNSVDALAIMKHTVSLERLEGIRLMAADVDRSGYVNATDALVVSRRFVGQISGFAAGDWAFETGQVFVPGVPPTPGTWIEREFLLDKDTTLNIYALAYGDCNGSFIPSAAKGSSSLDLKYSGQLHVIPGAEVRIPVYAKDAVQLGAVSLALDIPGGMEITGVEMNTADGHLDWAMLDGQLRISWFSLEPTFAAKETALLYIIARVDEPANAIMRLGEGSEIANLQIEVLSASLLTPKLTIAQDELSMQVYPNPLSSASNILIQLPEPGTLQLELINAMGASVAILAEGSYAAGRHQFMIERAGLKSGVYLLRLQHQDKVRITRLIVR